MSHHSVITPRPACDRRLLSAPANHARFVTADCLSTPLPIPFYPLFTLSCLFFFFLTLSHTNTLVHTHACTHACMHTHTHTHERTHTHKHTHEHKHTHMNTHTNTHMNAHTHTHTHTFILSHTAGAVYFDAKLICAIRAGLRNLDIRWKEQGRTEHKIEVASKGGNIAVLRLLSV